MAWKKQQQQSMNLHREVFENRYQESFNKWNDRYTDDRQLFCNIYKNVLPEFEKMKKVNSNFINVAFNRMIEEEETILKSIIENFRDMELNESVTGE